MRRRRPHLQVALFPFLSVLLCTLGSLILLLLVLDQKARQQRDDVAAQLRQEEKARRQQVALDLAEWQARLEAERDLRMAQRTALEDEAGRIRSQTTTTVQERERLVAQLATRARDMEAEAESQRKQLQRFELLVAERASLVESVQQRRTSAETERDKLAAQIKQLEQLLAEMKQKAAVQLPPTYSLVPYKGSHGTNRQPIYLECIGNQAIFRPDNESLWYADVMEGEKLVAAVKARAERLKTAGQNPYVLALIRPSAVPLYYLVLRTLQRESIDVGYELIEEAWQVDFSRPPDEWVAAQTTQQDARVAAKGSSSGTSGGSGGTGNASRPSFPPTGQTGIGSSPATGPTGRLPGPIGFPGSGNSPSPPQGPVTNHAPQGTGVAPWRPVPSPSVGLTAPKVPGETGRTGQGEGQAGRILPSQTQLGRPEPGQAQGGEKRTEQAQGSGTGSEQIKREGTAPRRQKTDANEPSGPPGPPGPPPPPESEERPKAQRQGSGGSGSGGLGGPGVPAGPRPLGSTSSSEYLITVECRADGVLVQPGKNLIDPSVAGSANQVLQVVEERIRTKLKYDPRARPQLHFVIRPDGLRNYYQAAGALATLRLPSTWEIVKDEKPAQPAQSGSPE